MIWNEAVVAWFDVLMPSATLMSSVTRKQTSLASISQKCRPREYWKCRLARADNAVRTSAAARAMNTNLF